MIKKFWEVESPIKSKYEFTSYYGNKSEIMLALYEKSNMLQIIRSTMRQDEIPPTTRTTTINLDDLSKDPAALDIFARITEFLKSKELEAKK